METKSLENYVIDTWRYTILNIFKYVTIKSAHFFLHDTTDSRQKNNWILTEQWKFKIIQQYETFFVQRCCSAQYNIRRKSRILPTIQKCVTSRIISFSYRKLLLLTYLKTIPLDLHKGSEWQTDVLL